MGLHFENPNIKVSKLFCDKLSFTIDYALASEHQHIQKSVESAGKLALPYRRRPYRRGALIYEGEYPSQMTMALQWEPMHSGVSFFRSDFNPAYADMSHVFAMLHAILPGGFDDVWHRAVVTRFDAAVDITGILPHRLLAYYPKKTVSRIHSKSGVIETMYIGSAQAANRVVIYDKLLQLKEKNQKFSLSFAPPTSPTTRLEIRMKPEVSLECLAKADNPFLPLVLRPASLFAEEGPEVWRLFIALVQLRGAQDSLLLLDKATREAFKFKLEAVACDWWKPETLWAGWENLLTEVFMVSPYIGKAEAA